MKKMIQKYLPVFAATIIFVQYSCNKIVDLEPINEISDASYWRTAGQFQLAANEFYTYLFSFGDVFNDAPHADRRGDLMTVRDGANAFSSGTNTIPASDGNWDNAFRRIRATNYLLERAGSYPNPDEIKRYVAEAKFFRAYVYFDLLQQFGGVPIIDKLLDVSSSELQGGRNSRDEVVDFIVTNLESAIPDLPQESEMPAVDKGRISKGAAQAFLGRVTLYEGSWQKFRNNASRANSLLDKSIASSDAVINSSQYQLFAPAALGDSALKYLFILENQQSNPANINKSANKEYILSNRYDFALRQIRMNITHSALNNVYWPSKKFADLFLSQDGLPIDKSPLFQGYSTTRSEYINRDNRMQSILMIDQNYYWDNENPGSRVTWKGDGADIANSRGKHNGANGTGYNNQKWAAERRLQDNEEAYDYPVIRYAEVLLNYAEAVFERNENISDGDLDKSLNLVRNRINKNMPKLSNGLVSVNGLDMRTEIRRERSIELYFEGFRVDDLKRWKTAETELPKPIEGITWTGTEWQTKWASVGSKVVNGIYQLESGRQWAEKNYLLPVPSVQIQLNPNLAQNPGW